MRKGVITFIITHLVWMVLIWGCWSFVIMDMVEPIRETFLNEGGRGFFLAAFLFISFVTIVALLPEPKKDK